MTKENLPQPLKDFLENHWPGVPIRPLYGPDGVQAKTWLVESLASRSARVMQQLENLADAHQATILFF